MIKKQDAERIIKERQRRLDELSRPGVWDCYTKNMECGELREFKQSCIDDEIIIEALKPYAKEIKENNTELTDEQVVQILKCCDINRRDCGNCFLYNYGEGISCSRYKGEIAIDLINRLKADVERLETGQLKEAMTFNGDTINNAVNEALTEFWNRLKSQNTLDERIVSVASGDNLLKELVGED